MRRETLTRPEAPASGVAVQKANMAAEVRRRTSSSWSSAPTFPDRVYVESTNVCNLDCIMCPTGLHIDTRPKGYIEWDLYTAIIDEIAPFGRSSRPALVGRAAAAQADHRHDPVREGRATSGSRRRRTRRA